MTTLQPDSRLVDGFASGVLDQQGQAALARQVARMLPARWMLPNPGGTALSKIIRHLGGDEALFSWLDRYPGPPRLVASVYELIMLLDAISDRPTVVTALLETRQRIGLPPELGPYLAPATGPDTLADLAGQIESLLADEDYDEAVRASLATVDVLQRIAPVDPYLAELDRHWERLRARLRRAGEPR